MIELEEFELWRDRGEETPLIIRGEAYLSVERTGSVIICHGFKGFAHWAFFPYLATELANAGLCAVTFDFSGSGIGEDRESFTNYDAFTHNTYRQELDDLEAVIAEAKVRDWVGDKFGLFGHSRGGGVAILHACENAEVRALVTWAAVSSTNRWSADAVREWRERGFIDIHNARTGQTIPLSTDLLREIEQYGDTTLNVAFAAAGIRVPWLIMHGAGDETVPVWEGEHLHELSRDASTLRIVEGANHAFGARHPLDAVPPELRTVTQETVDFYLEHLARRTR